MLPKNFRVPASILPVLFRKGRRIQTPDYQLIIRPNTVSVSRCAVVVGTKIDKRAVVRNRIKRLLRESLSHLMPAFVQHVDCLIIVTKNIQQKTQHVVESELKDVLVRNALI